MVMLYRTFTTSVHGENTSRNTATHLVGITQDGTETTTLHLGVLQHTSVWIGELDIG